MIEQFAYWTDTDMQGVPGLIYSLGGSCLRECSKFEVISTFKEVKACEGFFNPDHIGLKFSLVAAAENKMADLRHFQIW